MKKTAILAVIWLLALPALSTAQTTNVLGLGSQEAAWLDISNSARYEAMGGAGVAVADDVNALGVNPAGLGQLNDNEASVMYNSWFQGTAVEQGQAAIKTGPGFLGVGIDYLNLGSVDSFTLSGGSPVANGVLQPSAWMGQAAYGLEAEEGFYLGAAAKILQDNLTPGDSQTGFAMDLGALWAVPQTNLKVGMSVLNMGSFDSGATPDEWDLGLSYSGFFDPENRYLVTGEVSTYLNDFGAGWLAVGAEYRWHDLLAVRVGQRLEDTAGLSGWSGLSAGVGVDYAKLELDFAFSTQADLGSTSEVSLLARF
ncbi:MAG TPA: PorV/PorQ family protein [bacterium]|jgi:hypothetical protein|nr:PorV/PorQ family protein [bacterium]